MLNYIVRRLLYSVLILLGVILLTFLLFNVSSGDPAAAVLGKNARPEEIESLRRELGADLPLLWGRKCSTEAYSCFESGLPLAPDVRKRADGQLEFSRRFAVSDPIVCCWSAGKSVTVQPAAGAKFLLPGICEKAEFFRLQPHPWNSQFLRAVRETLTFDFGCALTTREPIREILLRGVWPSLALMLPIFFGELFFGVLFALVAAALKDTWADRFLVLISVAGMSISYLVIIIFVQWFFGYRCGWFPVWGWESWRNLGLPVIAGVLSGVGANVRFYRTVFADERRKEYLRTAAAKGASPQRIYGIHLLRNAALQLITRAGAALPFLFTGSLLLESFFGIPGLGFAGVEALYNSDLQLLKALVVTSALLFVILNLLTDLAYAWADPRIRLE